MRLTFSLSFLLFLIFGAGCSFQPVHLELDKTYSQRLDKKTIASISCPISLKVFDHRKNKKTYAKVINSETLINWVEIAFQESIKNPHISSDNLARQINVTVSVRQAYIHHLSTSHSAILAVDLEVNQDKYYIRGRDTSILWWGAASEYTRNLNGALDKALLDMSEIISLECQEKPLELSVNQ